VCAAASRAVVAAGPAADTLLPSATRAFLSLPQFPDANARWDKTRLGQLIADPALDPFFEDLRRQLREKWAKNSNKLGTTWEDFEQAATGEAAVALIHAPGAKPAVALIVDVTGRVPQAQQLLAKVAQDMANRNGRRGRRVIEGANVDVFEFPPEEAGQPAEYAYYTIAANLLIGADEQSAMEAILRRLAARMPVQDVLARNPAYQAVLARAQQGAKNDAPQARWFIEPLGLMAAIESERPRRGAAAQGGQPAARPGQLAGGRPGQGAVAQSARPAAARPAAPGASPGESRPARRKTQAEIARDIGFGAIQGVGGYVYMPADRYDFLSYTAVYAPKPWQKSMNMLAFPNGADLSVQPWVPADVATQIAFNVDVKQAEANFEPLFDQVFGEGEQGVWTDVKDSLRDDPNGPKVDLVKDLVMNMGQQATFITDYITPISPTCERTCLAVVAVNEKALAEAIRKSMATDPNVRHRQFQGYDIWEMTDETVAAPDVEIEQPGQPPQARQPVRQHVGAARSQPGQRSAGQAEEGEEEQTERLLPRSAVTVAKGWLFIASHVDFLEKILSQDPNTSLASTADYQAVMKEMQSLGASQDSFRIFVRQARAVHPTYDLARANKLPEAQTMLGNLLNRLLAQDPDQPRKAEIDGSKLPPFEQVERYFGLSGMFVTTEANGWFGVGFSPKALPTQVGARQSRGINAAR
jgi:hypothetical protein